MDKFPTVAKSTVNDENLSMTESWKVSGKRMHALDTSVGTIRRVVDYSLVTAIRSTPKI